MLSSFRNRFGIPGVISVIALVFAMLGGAYAASNSGGGKATASAKAKKGPRGPRGPAGPAGPAGPQGPAGAKGDTGAAGSNGSPGAPGEKGEDGTTGAPGAAGSPGKSVTLTPISIESPKCNELGGTEVKVEGAAEGPKVCNGAKGLQGEKGEKGDPWALNSTLPVGATERGAWAFNATTADTEGAYVPISFPIQAATGKGSENVHFSTEANFEDFDGGEPGPLGCSGTMAAPNAPSGHLCVFVSVETGVANAEFDAIFNLVNNGIKGFNRAGALLHFKNITGAAYSSGSWAVTGF